MIEYVLESGERKSVKPEHEEAFKKEYPTAKLAGGKTNGDAKTGAVVKPVTTASNQGTDLSNNNNQETNTGSGSEDTSLDLQAIEDAKKVRSKYNATEEQTVQAGVDSGSYVDDLMDESQDDAEDSTLDKVSDVVTAGLSAIKAGFTGGAVGASSTYDVERNIEEATEKKARKDEREKLNEDAIANLLEQRNEASEDQIDVTDDDGVNTDEYEDWLETLSEDDILSEAKNIKKAEFVEDYRKKNMKKVYEEAVIWEYGNPMMNWKKSTLQKQDFEKIQKGKEALNRQSKEVVVESEAIQSEYLGLEEEIIRLQDVNRSAETATKNIDSITKSIESSDKNIGGLVSNIESIDTESREISEREYTTQEEIDKANAKLAELNSRRSELFTNYEEQVESRTEAFTNYESIVAERNSIIDSYRESGGREWEDIKADSDNLSKQAKDLHKKQINIGSTDNDISQFLDAADRNYNITAQGAAWLAGGVLAVGAGASEVAHKLDPKVLYLRAQAEYGNKLPEFMQASPELMGLLAMQTGSDRAAIDAVWKANERLSASVEEPPKYNEINSWSSAGEWAAHATLSQAANTAIVAATGGAAMLVLGGVSAGSKFHEMDKEMERYAELPENHPMHNFKYSWGEQYAVAIGSGLAEGGSEYFTVRALGNIGKQLSSNRAAKRGFGDFIKRNFLSTKGLYENIYDPIEEGVTEGMSQFASNLLDKYVSGNPEKAGMSLWEGVDESFISGTWMSGAVYKSPLIARNVALAFAPTNVSGEMSDISNELVMLTRKLSNNYLKDSTKEIIQNKITKLVGRHTQLLNETVTGIENMSNDDKLNLISHDAGIAALKKQNQDLSKDRSLTKEERRSLQEANKDEISLRVNAKNNIIAKANEVANKREVEKQTKKVEKKSKRILGKSAPVVRITKDNVTEELGKWKTQETSALTDQLNKLEQQEAAMVEKGDEKGLAEINEKKRLIQESIDDVKAATEADMLESHGSSSENTGKMFVNTEFAGVKGKTNVAHHEFLHQVLKNTLADNPGAAIALGNALESHLNDIDPDILTDSEYRNRLNAYKDQPESVQGEEKLALILDGIAAGHIKIEQTATKQVGNAIRRILQSNGMKSKAIKLDSPEAILDFIMDVNAGNKSIFFRSTGAIAKGAKEGFEVGQDLIKEFGGVDTKKSKKALKQSAEASARIQKIWDSKGLDGAMDILGDSFIKNNIKKFVDRRSEAPNFDRELLTSEIEYGLTGATGKNRSVLGLIMDYPAYVAKQKKSGEAIAPLAGFINKQLANRMIEASNNILDEQFGMELEEARTAEATETAEDIININIEENSELRRELGFDAKMIQTIRNAVIKTFGTKLPDIKSKDFRAALIQAFRTELKQPIQDLMGKGKDFDTFLGEHFQSVYKALPVETLVQMERMVLSDKMLAKYPNARRLFTKSRRITKPTEVDRLISEGKLPKDTNRESGPLLNTKLPAPNINEVMAFFRGQNMEEMLGYKIGASTLGTRKDKLAMEMGVELAFDATSETLQNEDVQEKRRGILEIQGLEQAENELAIIAKQINRNPNLKFSKEGLGPKLSIGISQKNRDIFLSKLPEVLDAIQSGDVSPRSAEDIKNKMKAVFKDELSAGTMKTGELTVASKNLVKYTETYDQVIAKVGDVREDLDTSQSLRDYLANASEEAILDRSLVQLFGDMLPKGFTNVTSLYNDPARVIRARQQVVSFVRDAKQNKGWSDEKILRALYTQFNGMYTSAGKSGDGRYIKDANGDFILDPMWEDSEAVSNLNFELKPGDFYIETANNRIAWLNRDKSMRGEGYGLMKVLDLDGNPMGSGSSVDENMSFEEFLEESKKLNGGRGIRIIQGQGVRRLGKFNGNKWKRYKKDDDLVKKGLAKVGEVKLNSKGNPIPQDFRGQVFLNSQDLIDEISKIEGFEDIKGKKWSEIAAERDFDRSTFSESSKAAVEDQDLTSSEYTEIGGRKGPRPWWAETKEEYEADVVIWEQKKDIKKKAREKQAYEGRDAQAKEAQEVSEAITTWYFQGIEDGVLDHGDLLMLGKMFGSGMKSPMKRAAGLGFIAVGMENVDPKKLGELAEYEHMIPTNKMILEMFKHFHKDGKVPSGFWNNYQVAVIPKTMDKALTRNGLRDFLSMGQTITDHIGSDSFDNKARYYNLRTLGESGMVSIRSIRPQDFGTVYGESFVKASDILTKSQGTRTQIESQELGNVSRTLKFSKEAQGMSTFDFDETLIVDGENFVIATKGDNVVEISSEDWPIKGPDLAMQGYEFDFSDFANVRGGKEGPLLQKMKNQIEKYGNKNVFVLTARQQDSATPIHEWLKSNGIDVPLENITGLGKSQGEAKAEWMLQKFKEGYNDMYFVDDALPNVKAVKDVLDQLDIKSKVVQAKLKFSKEGSAEFNAMLERDSGVGKHKEFSGAQAKLRGANVGGFKFFVPPSAEDFKGLLYTFLGKGKQGDADMKFFKEHLLDPFASGIRNINNTKQKMSDEYTTLKKTFPKAVKSLNKKVGDTYFTTDNAVRVYLWNQAGYEVPGLSKQDLDTLLEHVESNEELKAFADVLSKISRMPKGYVKPGDYWLTESIASDLHNVTTKINRSEFLAEWVENKNIIFSPENLNKIEAVYGTPFRDALEDILFRMEKGTNRASGQDKIVSNFQDWINGSVGAVMFFNTRSATLQTLSTVNFLDWQDNNLFKAAGAFANQKQYWSDFLTLFNSDMLKQRRAGMQLDVNMSELMDSVSTAKIADKSKAAIRYLLQVGFTPTQIADSFAISAGGATFYRNKIKKYLKEGMSQKDAETKAFEEFQEIAEETQQSSRPDLISQQQAGTLGRLILAWANTPMQYTRLTKKAISDLVNGRGDWRSNVSRIIYYGAAQNFIFSSLQTGLAFALFGGDEEEEAIKTKELRVANGMLDTLLRGIGVYGAMASTLKNTILQYKAQREKGYGKQNWDKVVQDMISLSPPIGSKIRKIMNAIKTYEYNKGVPEKMGMRIDNPILSVVGNVVESVTNFPLDRLIRKANNIDEAITGQHELWQRVALILGWNTWSIGIKDEDVEEAKAEVKVERKEKKAEEKKAKKAEEKKVKEEEKKAEEQKKKDEGFKQVRCSGIKSNGQRCSITIETKAKSAKCTYHKSYKPNEGSDRDNDGIKEYQCKSLTGSGKRCKNRTENTSKKCYAHQ